MALKITVGELLLLRLKQLGINHIFGVPGDYNLLFLDQIVNNKSFKWVNCSNELNAGYTADGYARANGMGVVVSTFGVGELSAINGLAGAYAERVPVIHIVGMPSTSIQKNKFIVHHTLCERRFDEFSHMSKYISKASAIISEKNAEREIDRVLFESLKHKLPGYLAIPIDLFHKKISVVKPQMDVSISSAERATQALAKKIVKQLQNSKNPAIMIDLLVERIPKLKKLVSAFIATTNISFVKTGLAKTATNDSHKNFVGYYAGRISHNHVKKFMQQADCILSFDYIPCDINEGGTTYYPLQAKTRIEINNSHTKINTKKHADIYCCDILAAVICECKKQKVKFLKKQISFKTYHKKQNPSPSDTISQKGFWQLMEKFFRPQDTIVAEVGTSQFSSMHACLPKNCQYITQGIWGSIGYSLGGLLGATIAKPKKRSILFIGDGSFQLTAQCISTMMRNRLSPIIFLINNDGYTIERAIHGWKMPYNDIQPWSYHELPKIFGKNYWSTKVRTPKELQQALKEIKTIKNKLIFIEVVMKKTDVPVLMQQFLKK